MHSLHLKFIYFVFTKVAFYLNLKWHSFHLKGISDRPKTLCPISNFFSCPKVVFPDKPLIAFFAFKICTGEYILCSFCLCIPKLYFHLNLKWHCLHLNRIQDPLKTLSLISTFWCLFFMCVPKLCFKTNQKLHSLHLKFIKVNISTTHLLCSYQSCIFT